MATNRESAEFTQAPPGTFEYISNLYNKAEGGIGTPRTKRFIDGIAPDIDNMENPTWFSVGIRVREDSDHYVHYSFGITDNDMAINIKGDRNRWAPDNKPVPIEQVSIEEILKEIQLAERSQRRLKRVA